MNLNTPIGIRLYDHDVIFETALGVGCSSAMWCSRVVGMQVMFFFFSGSVAGG
jgi:hypothetical protein